MGMGVVKSGALEKLYSAPGEREGVLLAPKSRGCKLLHPVGGGDELGLGQAIPAPHCLPSSPPVGETGEARDTPGDVR